MERDLAVSLMCRVLLSWALLIIASLSTADAADHLAEWVRVANDAVTQFNNGEVAQAENKLSELISASEFASDKLPKSLAQLLLARMLISGNHSLDSAKSLLQDAETYFEDTLGAESPELGQAWHLEGRILLLEGNLREAEDVLRKALAVAKRGFGGDSYQVAIIFADLSVVYARLGRLEIAQPLQVRADKFFSPKQPLSNLTNPPSVASSLPADAAVPQSRLSRGTRAYIISLAIILFFTAIHFLLSFGRLEHFFRFGIFCCLGSLVIGSVAVAALPEANLGLPLREGLLVVALLSVLNLMVSTLGMSYCSYSAIVDAPLIRALLRRRVPTVPWTPWVVNTTIVILLAVGFMRGFSWLAVKPQLTAPLIPGGMMVLHQISIFAASALFLAVAVTEALIFRLFLQNFVAAVAGLSASRYLLAITVAATLWALGHSQLGGLGPLRFLELLPVGIGLGQLAKRQGIESAILAQFFISLLLF